MENIKLEKINKKHLSQSETMSLNLNVVGVDPIIYISKV